MTSSSSRPQRKRSHKVDFDSMENKRSMEWSPSTSHLTISSEDDDDVVAVSHGSTVFTEAFRVYNELRAQGALCDVAIVAGGCKFTAHKVVLAATIPYFRAMFTNDMAEADQRVVEVHDVEADALGTIISYAYSGEVRLTCSNVQSVMIAANYLQLNGFVEACATFLLSRISLNNVIEMKKLSSAISCRELSESCERFLQKNFVEVAESSEFLELPLDQIRELLSRDELYVDSEENVFHSAINWLKHNPERQAQAASVLQCVRMPLLSPSFLADKVSVHEFVRNNLECRDLVDEAKDYHLLPERRVMGTRTKQRCCRDVPGLMFAIGGLVTNGNIQSSVEMYDPVTRTWSACQNMRTVRSRVGVAVHENKVYTIGGFDGRDRLRVVEVLDYNKNEWQDFAALRQKRSALSVAILHNKMYVCGGYDGNASLDTVEVYNFARNKWEEGQPMLSQRSAAGIAVLDNFIYVIGGHDGISIFRSVERFNPDTKRWETMPQMNSKRCRLGATAFNGYIYVCGGYDGTHFLNTVERFDPRTKTWTTITPMLIKRSRVSLAATTTHLYAVGGFDGGANLSSVEEFNPQTETWKFAPSMITHEGGVGVAVLSVRNH